MIYNRYAIDLFSNKIVYIHDDIADTVFTTTDKSVGTWAGDLSISKNLDWNFLKGRTVRLVFDKFNISSVKVMHDVICNLMLNYSDSSLYPVSDYDFSDNYQDFCDAKIKAINKLTSTNLCLFRMNVLEFYDFARSHHGLDLNHDKIDVKSIVSTNDNSMVNNNTEKFMVEPLIREGEFGVIVAEKGVGKTFVALDISLMVATGKTIGDRFSATKAYKVLYIDSEMPEGQFLKRKKDLMVNYENAVIEDDCFVNKFFRDRADKLDLSTTRGQQYVQDRIKDAKLIVFDNLGGIVPPSFVKYDEQWAQISSWIRSLTRRGITVLLVHHENKEGEPRGTLKIMDDADLVIALKKPDGCPTGRTINEFLFKYPRFLSGDDIIPFMLEYRTENSETRRTISPHGTAFNDIDKTVVATEIKSKTDHTDLEKEILNPVRHTGILYVKPEMFIVSGGKSGKSKGSVSKAFNRLRDIGLLIRTGKKRGTKYVLKENWGDAALLLSDLNHNMKRYRTIHQ